MVYRKGELSKAMMERDWPHQVALPAYRCLGHNYLTMRFFCEGEGLSLCPHTHSLRRGDQDMLVFCFAQRQHAEQFHESFDGEFIDPKSRPKRLAARNSAWAQEIDMRESAASTGHCGPAHRFQRTSPSAGAASTNASYTPPSSSSASARTGPQSSCASACAAVAAPAGWRTSMTRR